MTRVINLSLIENAESFISEALAKAIVAETNPAQWKFAVLSLVQAIELTLKAILNGRNWSLVYQDVDKRKLTVSLETALDRLVNIEKLNFSKSDIDAVKTAISLRNEIVHYAFSYEEDQVKLVFVKLLGFVQHCFSQYLGRALGEVVEEDLWGEAISLFGLAEELSRRARERMVLEGIEDAVTLSCRRCDFEFFVPRGYSGTCYVCGCRDDVVPCAYCRQPIYYDGAAEIADQVFICESCLEVGVVVNADGKSVFVHRRLEAPEPDRTV
jgi:hypothetical protein